MTGDPFAFLALIVQLCLCVPENLLTLHACVVYMCQYCDSATVEVLLHSTVMYNVHLLLSSWN